tara:strand:- start:125 stop:388 length:264 start_codon:yes stop_codon:yes gene_type:complete
MNKHLIDTFNSISHNQWLGLFLAIIGSTLAWIKLIFIISPLKKNKPKIGKYQIYALFIGWLITTFGWAKYLAIADPLNNKKNCICKR